MINLILLFFTEEWMLDNPSQPKVFTLSGFTPYGKYYTAEVMEQEKKTLIENIKKSQWKLC